MEQKKIDRINQLAKKARECELCEEEKIEQAALRREYIDAYKTDLEHKLKQIRVMDQQGNPVPLQKKKT